MNAPDLNVITVVDPQDDTEIEIRPQEILQVVLCGKKSPAWRIETQLSDFIRLKVLRHETFFTDGFERVREGNFQVVPHTQSFGALQNHFWFRVDPAACKKIQEVENNYIPIVIINFHEDGKIIGRLKVNLVLEKEDKNEFFDLMEQTILTGKDPLAHEAQILGLSNRRIDEENGYILNPGWADQVMFECRQRMMMVELAEPPDSKLKWRASATSNWQTEVNYAVSELTSRFINGIRVQRFLIKNFLKQLPIGVTKMRLGDVKFSLAGGHPKWDKKINFFVSRDREVGDYSGEEDAGCDEDAYYFLRQMEQIFKPRKPRKMPVTIEEMDIKGDLRAGAKLIQVFLPKNTNSLEIADPADNSMVTVPLGEELIVQLYKDPRLVAPNYEPGEWKVESSGKCLKSLYMIGDYHRQRFFFKRDPESTATGETLIFKMRDKVKKLYVMCPRHSVVQEVKSETPDSKDVDKVLNEMLTNMTYEWRTVTSLSFETGLSQTKVANILDMQEKKGKVKQHPSDFGTWGHCERFENKRVRYEWAG